MVFNEILILQDLLTKTNETRKRSVVGNLPLSRKNINFIFVNILSLFEKYLGHNFNFMYLKTDMMTIR